jgi:hypothetical protein
MRREPTGHIEQLPSGSYRVSVYVGTDPLTRRPIRLRATAKTETQARIELGHLHLDGDLVREPGIQGRQYPGKHQADELGWPVLMGVAETAT